MQGETLATQLESLRERVHELRARVVEAGDQPDTGQIVDEVEDCLARLRVISLPEELLEAPLGDSDASAVRERPASTPEDALADFLPDAYLFTDADGIVRRANPAAAALLCKPLWKLAGKPLVLHVKDVDRQRMRSLIAQMRDLVRVDGWKVSLERGTEDAFHAELTAAAVFAEDGSVRAIRWLLRRSRAPAPASPDQGGGEALVAEAEPQSPTYIGSENQGKRLAFLAQASAVLARSLNPDHTLASAAQLALPTLGDVCIVDLLDDQAFTRLHVAYSSAKLGNGARRIRRMKSRMHELVGTATARFRGGEPLLLTAREGAAAVDTLLDDSDSTADVLGRPAGSCLLVPLVARGQLLGVMTFIMLEPRRHHGMADVLLARELGSRAALAADNAGLYRLAQRASEAKSNFLASMSHELRTPLTAIVGYTELLAEGVVGEVTAHQREQLLRIRAASDHLLHIVEEILTYARLEAKRDSVKLEDVDATQLADQAITLISPIVRQRGLEFAFRKPDRSVTLRTDPLKLRQILVNLLANAVKFTVQGRVELDVKCRDELVTFEVSDTGIGIAKDHLEHIFEPFWQAQQHLTRGYGGTGLGLPTARKMARLLGGEVSVTSGPEGSRFKVWLPVSGPADASPSEGHV